MTSRKFNVAVIIINYNSSAFTIDCIESIRKSTSSGIRYQVVVIDNNSTSKEYEKLSVLQAFSEVTLFRSRFNSGFSGANMMGIQLADADYYYFLNNDTILLNDCLGLLFDFMQAHPHVGNCSGEMFNAKGDYEYNFRYFPTLLLKLTGSSILRLFDPEGYPDKYQRLKTPTRVDLVNGSSMFVRATSFEAIGGFDTHYFLYCEEEDLALRLKRAGFLTYLVPAARYQHFENKSSQSTNAIRLPFLKEFYISFLYYYQKNYGIWHRLIIQFLYFFKLVRKFYIHRDYVTLAFFVVSGAPMRQSLRFKQKID